MLRHRVKILKGQEPAAQPGSALLRAAAASGFQALPEFYYGIIFKIIPSITYWAGLSFLWDKIPGKLTSHSVLPTSPYKPWTPVWSLAQWQLLERPLLLASGHTCPICPSVLAVSLCT